MLSYRRVAPSGTGALHRVEDPPRPVLEEVRDIADGVTVRQQVPAAGAVAVIVQPGPKDQVGRSSQEHAVQMR